MATKGAQSIQNTCTASNNVVDVSSHCKVISNLCCTSQKLLRGLQRSGTVNTTLKPFLKEAEK